MLPEFDRLLPPTIKLSVLSDRSESIRDSVHDVQLTLIMTAVLVILVILAFLRTWRATFIPAIALPLSIIGTFAGMAMLNFSLDNVSLLALTLALGFVVDDAIVVLENIVRYVEQGMKPFDAAIKGATEIGFTVLSITMSLVAVFIPILFMGGIVGRFFFEFAMTISIAIALSGFVSLTLTPMLCSRLLKAQHWRREAAQLSLARVRGRLQSHGARIPRHARRVAARALAHVAADARHRGGDGRRLRRRSRRASCRPRTPTSSSCARKRLPTSASMPCSTGSASWPTRILADPDVLYINSNVAQSFFNPTLNRGSIFVQLKVRGERVRPKAASRTCRSRLRRNLADIPGIRAFPVPLQNLRIGSRSGAALYQYTLTSVNQTELYDNAQRLIDRVKQAPGFADVTSDLTLGARQLTLDIDRDELARLGLTMDVVRSTLYSAFGIRKIATVYTPSNDYAVLLETDQAQTLDPAMSVQGVRALEHRPAGAARARSPR